MSFANGAGDRRCYSFDHGNTSMKYADGVTEVQVGDRIRLENGEEATVTDFAAIVVRTDRGAFAEQTAETMEKIVFLKRVGPPR
jgi:hypothetical protein